MDNFNPRLWSVGGCLNTYLLLLNTTQFVIPPIFKYIANTCIYWPTCFNCYLHMLWSSAHKFHPLCITLLFIICTILLQQLVSYMFTSLLTLTLLLLHTKCYVYVAVYTRVKCINPITSRAGMFQSNSQ